MKSPLLEQFLTEGRELIEDAATGLLELEQSPNDETTINQIFRSVHTLKGNSGLFEYPALTQVLHVAEELMVKVRDRTITLNPTMMDALLGATDQVRTYLDEIDDDEQLSSDSKKSGERLVEVIRSFLDASGGTGGGNDEAPADEPLPEWAIALSKDILAPGPDGPVTLFEYRPGDSCFFRGEDPVLTVAQVSELRWRSLALSPEAATTDDDYVCTLLIRGVTAAPRSTVEHALRYVDDEATITTGPSQEAAAGGGSDAPADDMRLDAAKALIQRQEAVLSEGGPAAAPSVRVVLERSLGRLGEEVFAAEAAALPQVPTPEQLIDLIRRWTAEREKRAQAVEVIAEPEAAASSEGSAKDGSASRASRVLRVDQSKVDRLMNLIGQLVVAKNGLPYVVRGLEQQGGPKGPVRELKEHSAIMDRIARELQSAIMEVRMLPVSQVFQRFPRLVRDVSRKLDKKIELTMTGEETQADKNVIEALSEPLVHLVRNALDHGIEPPTERVAKGKPDVGHIRLNAWNENETVVISIEDDGRGLDPHILREKAERKGVHPREVLEKMSDDEARMLIFAAGFSTKEQASELSGRGVGMDVVRATIEKAGGRVSLESEIGEGTRITLHLPLSMAVSHVMTVTADRQLYGIGMDSVVETVRRPTADFQVIKGREALVLRDQLIPVLRLRSLLDLSDERYQNAYGEEAVLVLKVGGENVGLVVDEFGENIEVLVRPLEGLVGQMKEYSGSAVLGDGRLLLVLDMKELMRHVG